ATAPKGLDMTSEDSPHLHPDTPLASPARDLEAQLARAGAGPVHALRELAPSAGTLPSTLVIRRVPLDALHQDPANARTHGPRNLEAISSSLTRFTQVEP